MRTTAVARRALLRAADRMRRTDALAMYEDFCQSQWYHPGEVERRQWLALRSLLDHAYQHVPHYRRTFDELGLRPTDVDGPAALRQLPVLTKDAIRADPASFLADDRDRSDPRWKRTGGSLGEPLKFLIDRRAHSAQWAFIYRGWNVGGWQPGDKVVVLGGASLYPSTAAAKKRLYTAANSWLFLSAFDLAPQRVDGWVRRLRRFGGRYLYAYASSAYELALLLEARGTTDITFDAVFTTAEVLHPRYRVAIERVFDTEVFDLYGGSDGAGYAFECEQHRGMHVVSENSLIEIVDEDDRPVPPGRPGRMISTDLFNTAMPFIRYDVGDISSLPGTACACGRGLPLLGEVVGRSSDFVSGPDGERIHEQFFSHTLRSFDWVSQYCVRQERSGTVRVLVRPTGVPDAGDLQRIEAILRRRLGDLHVVIELTATLPTTSGGKHRLLVNEMLASPA